MSARRAGVVAVVVALLGGACSSSDDGGGSSAAPAASASTGSTPVTGGPLLVDLIDDAIAALEGELGGPQTYYEINATPSLVNLFVATDGGTVTPWVFLGGALTSADPAPAEGNTFGAAAVYFDPATVLSTVTTELPTSIQEVFAIDAGADGSVRYTVLVTSAAGGQLVVQVSGTGAVLGVDPQ